MKSALIVDDHPVVRAAVKLVLEAERFRVIHEASSASEALELSREHKPELVILDLKLPGVGGLEALERLKANDPECRVLIFTSQDPLHYQDRCLRSGAMGYVAKTNQLLQLHKAVQALMSGYSYFAALPDSGSVSTPSHRSEKQLIDELSNRELNILVQLALGKPNKKIAAEMFLSHKTVSTYKTRLIKKLGLHSKSAVYLREFAKRNDLI
ncbi:MAG: response regulator transcription factor [Pseudomonas sp.]|jgi:two-component system response regulator EvgA|uniref:Response regulator transcription factor n=3 Tax=Pseudomonas TaxID=286 RepID=A0A5C4KR61_PSEJE|nr:MULTISPECIES: response regulator transcription factor [Pseudomonas]MBY8957169.1 response regulator transcription factor [Pseudomonas sp. MIS38]PHH43442.1 DNA-binding response regulator [Pseudomonas putida]QBR31314.1 response regulator transcription factor [Pseudomonas sp. S150]QBX40855.1 response regulator transcription factor [Pseudomonas fluorescens]TNB91295.1 response regulator transcription factor [Pseudomonas jessenii]